MIIGKKIIHYKEIDSTNEEARRLIKKGAGEGLVLVAEEQTKGRGKPGSFWFSPKGNLYLSAVIKPYRNPEDLAPLTLLAALSARSAVFKVSNLPVIIKWPNDLLVKNKKVGGILVERIPSGHLIIGIGININSEKSAFPEEIRAAATSLREETGKSFLVKDVVEKLILELDKRYAGYLRFGRANI